MNAYRNFLTYVANQDLALDLRPLTVIVGPHDTRIPKTFQQLQSLAACTPVGEVEIHNLLHQFHVAQEPPPELQKLMVGRLYEGKPLNIDEVCASPAPAPGHYEDPGPQGEHLFACFAGLPEQRRHLIMGHLKHVFGHVEFGPLPAPTYWREEGREVPIRDVPPNRLYFLWLMCALYDSHPLKLLYRPERGPGGLSHAAVDALVSAFRNAGSMGQVLIVTYHSGIISRLAPEEVLLVPPSKRQGIWCTDLDPDFFEDKGRLLRFAMGLAA